MNTRVRIRFRSIALTTAAILMLTAPAGWADDDEIEFEEAHIFFELNDTDGDLGIHGLIDGEPWKELEIEGPLGREMLDVDVRSRLRRQGLTEFFFESAEPTFDELDPEDFFGRFPEGEYEIEGETLEGYELESTAELTHLIPAAPVATVNGAGPAEICDDEDPDFDEDLVPSFPPQTPITITWPEVTLSHLTLGDPKSSPIEVHNYEVVLETELELNDDELTVVSSTILPPGVTSLTFSDMDFLALADEWKYEVLVREESFNQTAMESCFVFE